MENEKSPSALIDRVRLIRIQAFFRNAAGNPLSLLGTGVISALLLRDAGAALGPVLIWFSFVALNCLAIFLFERHVKRVGLMPGNANHLFRIRFLLGAAVCALFGATVLFLPGLGTGTPQAYVFIVATSIVAVGYMAYATEFAYCMTVNALTLVPFSIYCIISFFSSGDAFFALMALVAITWQFVVAAKALRISRSVVGEIVARERLHDEMAERSKIEAALVASEEQSKRLASMLRLMCDNVPDMIWAKDHESRYTFANKALCEKLLNASSTEEPLGKTFEDFARRERERHPENAEWYTLGQFWMDVDRHTLSRDEPTVFEESGTVCGNFVFLDVHQACFIDSQGQVIGTVGSARDITERKASEMFVQHLAHHDVLTDLPNRALLTERLHQALAHGRRDRVKLAVLFIDLDRLKPVNDSLGHDVGDVLLKQVAGRLRDVLTREADTVARLGGDEFVILLPRINKDADAAAVAERILQALGSPFHINAHVISISASIGIAIFPRDGAAEDGLLRNADVAMYEAKRAGRNCFRFVGASTAAADDYTDAS